MTDRWKGFTVLLEKDIRDDDGQCLLEAIKCLRGVLKVTPRIADFDDWEARERVKAELTQEMWEVLHPKEKK